MKPCIRILSLSLALILCFGALIGCNNTTPPLDNGGGDGGSGDGGNTPPAYDKHAKLESLDPYLYDFLDFAVEVESGKDPVVLQITDTDIMDAAQARYEGRFSDRLEKYFATANMEARVYGYLRELITKTKPDLILVTGDMVVGELDDSGSAFSSFIAFMEGFDIPWAPVFGDREAASAKGIAWQCAQLEAAEYCLFKRGTVTGNGNYAVGLAQDGKLLRTFVMLDTNGCENPSEQSKADGGLANTFTLAEDQIAYLEQTVKQIRILSKSTRFSTVHHAPLPEVLTVLSDKHYGVGCDIDALTDKESDFGYVGTTAKVKLTGSVFSLLDTLRIDSVFFGHVHANSASVVFNGVRLTYGQKSSVYESANYEDADGAIRHALYSEDTPVVGGTVIPIDAANGKIKDPFIHLCDATPYDPDAPVLTYDKYAHAAGVDERLYDYLDFTVDVPAGKTPVVLQITDPQLMDSTQRRPGRLSQSSIELYVPANRDLLVFDYLSELFTQTKPDLILLTGDITYGEFDDNGSMMAAFVNFMEEMKIPWAPIIGNHEGETKMGVGWICELFEGAEYCLFKRGTVTGNGNYAVGLTQGGELLRTFMMLDSNGGSNPSAQSLLDGQVKTSFGFGKDQVTLFTETLNGIHAVAPDCPVTFAIHAQLPQFSTALREKGYELGTYIEYEGGEEGDFGYVGSLSSSPMNADYFATFKSLGGDSVLVGHIHTASYSVVYEGVRLQYGQKSSAYEQLNHIDANGNITDSRAEDKTPLVGGTVMPIDPETGAIKDPYIYLCENAGGSYDWDNYGANH